MRGAILSSLTRSILVGSLLLSAVSLSKAGEKPATPYGGTSNSSAASEKPVTPYGDHSRDCTLYGTGNKLIPLAGAIHGLKKYYETRGYTVGNMQYRGRFIEAEIFRDGKQVDKVLFDRISGRVRSVY